MLEEEALQASVEAGTSLVTEPVEEVVRDISFESREFEKRLLSFLDQVKPLLEKRIRGSHDSPHSNQEEAAMPRLLVGE